MGNFKNVDYIEILTDCIHDIFYVETSYRGKIAQIRLFSEIIVRKIIDYEPERKLTIGDPKVLNQVESLENGDHIKQCILAIKDDTDEYHAANSCSHSKVRERITESDYFNIQSHLMDLISCIFIQYFSNHQFGSNNRIMSEFSLLPPSIRSNVLLFLYKNDDKNVNIIDRYVLATMKAYGAEKAQEWVEDNKEHLLSISAVSPDMESMADLLGLSKNMYDCCCEKINHNLRGIYYTFEEAKSAYEKYINNTENVEIEDKEVLEFLDLMEFVYIGRRKE